MEFKLSGYYFRWADGSNTGRLQDFLKERGHLFSIQNLQNDTTVWSREARLIFDSYIKQRKNEGLLKYWTEE